MYFDARAAKALQPGNHIVVDGCQGLRLVASASRKTWIYRYKSVATGQMKQVRLGHWPEMPVSAAVARWEELRAQRDAGADLRALVRPSRCTRLVRITRWASWWPTTPRATWQ